MDRYPLGKEVIRRMCTAKPVAGAQNNTCSYYSGAGYFASGLLHYRLIPDDGLHLVTIQHDDEMPCTRLFIAIFRNKSLYLRRRRCAIVCI